MSAISYLLDENESLPIGETIEGFAIIVGASEAEEYSDRLNYLTQIL